VDLVMDKTASGSDSFWRVVPTADFSVVHGVNSPSPTFNLLGTTVAGVVQATRPIVELIGPSRRMPPVVTTADQLLDPSGRIDADWKVSGRSCTIQPGVTLDFGEGFGLRVQHNLIALGTEQDSIRFTGDNWEGVQLFPEAGTRARFAHCVFGGLRNNGAALNYFGGSSSLVTEVRNSTFRNGNNGYAIYAEFGKLEAVGILIDGGQIGIHGADLSQLVLEDFVIRGSSGFGLELFDCPLEEPSSLRKGLVAGNGSTGIQLDDCSGLLDRVSVVDNGSFGLATYGNSVIQLVNCILANPASAYEISVDGSDFISTGYSTVLGGSARCDQSSGGVIQLGIQTLAGDPQLDALYHPLPGSPVIDAGSPLSTPDPDLTVADQGFFFFDQRAPLALSAVDVPEDQGGRLQFTWNASSMDLAEAERDNFYSVWRLDTLFSTSAPPCPWYTPAARSRPRSPRAALHLAA
jgi:hypothetical protein